MHVEKQKVLASVTANERGPHEVDLVLDASTLNERLEEIGLWLMDWQIPHEAKISMLPRKSRIRVSFSDGRHARAFEMRFADTIVDPDIDSAVR